MIASTHENVEVVKQLITAGATLPVDIDSFPSIKTIKAQLDLEFSNIQPDKLKNGFDRKIIFIFYKKH